MLLPGRLDDAVSTAENSDFVRRTLPEQVRNRIFSQLHGQLQEYSIAHDKSAFEDESYFTTI